MTSMTKQAIIPFRAIIFVLIITPLFAITQTIKSVSLPDCDPPANLDVCIYGPFWEQVKLTWDPPEAWPFFDGWFHWDNGYNFTSVGTGGPVEFDVAAYWEPAQIPQIQNLSIEEVMIYPAEESATYSLRIWQGLSSEPDTLLFEFTPESLNIGEWNTIPLPELVVIDHTIGLWIGYHIDASDGFPAGADMGPAVDGFGNVINFGGWTTLLETNPDLDYNWNISAHIVGPNGGNYFLHHNQNDPGRKDYEPRKKAYYSHYYQIYRSFEWQGEYDLIATASPYASAYIEDIPHPTPDLACYKMKAVYTENGDTCISDLSWEGCISFIISTDELEQTELEIYPNPVKNMLFVKVYSCGFRYDLTDISGNILKSGKLPKGLNHLKMCSFINGMYILKVFNEERSFSYKIIVQHE